MSKPRSEDNPNDFRYPIQSKPCDFCGYNFARLKDRSKVQWNDQRFCSLSCRSLHLYIGTHQQNMDDKTNRGRNLLGERNHQVKLTDDDVRAIRYATGTYTEIAEIFGISRPQAAKIIKRQAWTHIP